MTDKPVVAQSATTPTPTTKDEFEVIGSQWWHKVRPHPGNIYQGEGFAINEKQSEMVFGMIGRILTAAAKESIPQGPPKGENDDKA